MCNLGAVQRLFQQPYLVWVKFYNPVTPHRPHVNVCSINTHDFALAILAVPQRSNILQDLYVVSNFNHSLVEEEEGVEPSRIENKEI